MLSIVIASDRERQFRELEKNIAATALFSYEIIRIQQLEQGLCVAYQDGAKHAQFETLCFVHDDIIFHSKGWDQIITNLLQDETIGLVGVMGGRYKSLFGTSWRDGEPDAYRMQIRDGLEEGKQLVTNPNNKQLDEVVCLDGAFLACTKKNWQAFPFDDRLFNNFHFYDLDISLQMHTGGLRNIVTFDIVLEHFSQGKPNQAYLKEFLKFQQKWKSHLPQSVDEMDRKQQSNWDGYALAETVSLMKRLSFSKRERWKQILFYRSIYKNWYHVLRSFYFGFLK